MISAYRIATLAFFGATMQECLCVLVCDDSEDVSAAAQESLEYLFSSSDKHVIEHDVAEIFNRFVFS